MQQQQQQQQQQHLALLLEKSQRLQQQAVQQQQLQQQQQMAHAMSHSPNAQITQASTPPNAAVNNVKMLVDNFPRLLEMKRAGTLRPEQEKLVSPS